MTWLAFIAEMIKATAWPIAMIVVFLGLRRHLVDLLPSSERMQWKGLDLQFNRRVQDVVVEAEGALPPAIPFGKGWEAVLTARSREEQLMLMAVLSPRAAILNAWLGVESAATRAMARKGAGDGGIPIPSHRMLHELFTSKQILSEQQARVFEELRDLRNRAAHTSDLSLSESFVRDYVRATMQMERLLDERTTPAEYRRDTARR